MQQLHHWQRPLTLVLLIIILAVAAGLRFYNLNWDNGIFAHPDERSTVAFYAPTIQWPADSATLLDPRTSTLNPLWDVRNQTRRSYTYGHFPLYALVLTANVLNDLTPVAEALGLPQSWVDFMATSLGGHGFARIGRALMALADLFSVYLLFLIGRRLYGVWGGLLAAALSTFTVLQIQLAHFFAVDPVSTTFTLLAIYGAMLLYDRRNLNAAIITGIGIGLAVASKFSALPIAAAPVIAGALAWWQHRSGATPGPVGDRTDLLNPIQNPKSKIQNRIIGLVVASLAVSFVVFAVTSPFVLLDFENFRIAVIEEQGNMVSGVADFPFTRQYRNTPAYWYFIEQQLRWGMGWPLGVLALAGTLWVTGKAIIGKAQPGEVVALAWVVLYFGPTGLFLAKFMRYMIPVVPLFTLFGAGLVVALWKLGEQRRQRQSTVDTVSWAHGEAASLVDSEPVP
ncbi:MAG: glycosyltransferase family 39 protein, partial [Anaerolineae bacterium]|nr:glycosyltransferase family 39 protein [Anaerolineae bacterium]